MQANSTVKETKVKEKLDINVKPSVSYCCPIPIRDHQIRHSTKRIKGRIQPGELNDHSIAIVGFGASLKETWPELKNFKHIITCSGALKFLLEQGLNPADFDRFLHADVDPRPHKVGLLGTHHAVEYLAASCLHRNYFDKLEGFNVKLWHIFSQDGESDQVIPHGEWSITGGSDAGMRCMTLARFLGYRDFHIFGIDGNIRDTSHAADHPNAPPDTWPLEHNGVEFKTTPALLSCAQQVFHELNALNDTTYTFYGDGLIQEMAKDYVRKPLAYTSEIAYVKEELISDEMRKLNQQLHEENVMFGCGGGKHAETVAQMVTPEIQSVLDYGAGKGFLAKALPFPIWQYDPAVPEISEPPRPADLVVCSDVLEHIEPEKLKPVLNDLKRCVLKIGYFVIHTGPAKKTYADGRNAHLIIQNAEWWVKQISKFFVVTYAANVDDVELRVVVKPTPKPHEDPIAVIEDKAKFLIPNETTKWRAETLLKKEPITIKWIESMQKDDVLYDIGANVGGYSVWAGVHGIKVFAFEPEAENYALLVRNIALNKLDAQAYCLAITNKEKLDVLHMSQRGLGGSCHTFGAAVGAFGEHRNGNHPVQGCLGMALDDLLAKGLPQPDHIKIDVDGLEAEVIKGGHKVLAGVKTVLIEVNPALPTHLEMVDTMKVLGFTFDPAQVESARRKDGPFKGVAEYVFKKRPKFIMGDVSAADPLAETIADHLIAQINQSPYYDTPFRHCTVVNVLPDDIYRQLLKELRPTKEYRLLSEVRGTKGYPQRLVAPDSKSSSLESSICRAFMLANEALCQKMDADEKEISHGEMLLIRDLPGYQIGPHTDSPSRILSAILYLAKNDKQPELGTTLFAPTDGKFTCKGGPHYPATDFKELVTIPYLPNSMFVFKKTDRSFHGVKLTKSKRDVLLYDLRRK